MRRLLLPTMAILTTAALLVFCAVASVAQSTSAAVSGQITDATGSVIPETSVVFTNVNTGVAYPGKSNGSGFYRRALPPGIYRANVSKNGFAGIVKGDIELHVQDEISLNFTLKVGSVNETVTVQSGAQLVDTESAAVGTTIDRQLIENIPLNGRTLQNLINLTPGVVVTQSGFGDGGQFSVNGQRADSNYFTVDGVSANINADVSANVRETAGVLPGFTATGTTSNLVSVDAVQEFRVQTSTFAPEYGRTPGAQVSLLTKSGTNKFHGDLFEYFRNSALDASNWFNGFLKLPKGVERQNDFGGVLGGPIIHDKTFFFFSYEGQRLSQPTPTQTFVPDLASRAAAPPAIQPLLNAFPIPTKPETPIQTLLGIAEADGTAASTSSLNATALRIDHNITPSWYVFARYNYAPSNATVFGASGGSLNNSSITSLKTQTGTVGTTKVFGSHISNELLFNWSRYNTDQSTALNDFGGAVPPTIDQLVPASEGVTLPPGQSPSVQLTILGGPVFTVGNIGKNIQRQINLVDNFSYQIKSHQLKFGFDYRRLTPLTRPPAYIQIPVFCGTSFCPIPGLSALNADSGLAFEQLVISSDTVGLIFPNYSMYGQDTWQVTPRATLTYGLRYDINPAVTAQNVQLVRFVDPFDINNLALAPSGSSLYPTRYGNVAPRIGIAYRLLDNPNHGVTLRGGFGIFYDLGSSTTGGVATQFPFLRISTSLFQPFPIPAAAAAPIPFSLNPPYGEVTTVDPNLNTPRTYEYNAAVEQELGPNQTLSLTYVGAAGRDLLRNILLFPTSAPIGYTIQSSGGTSNYNALQAQYHRRLYQRVQALASYTWSHSIDTQSSNAGFNFAPDSQLDINRDRASSDFDVRNAFSAAVTYEPLGGNFGPVLNAFTHGWALDAIFIAQSAKPVDLSASTFVGPGGVHLPVRPDFVTGVPLFVTGDQFPGGRALNPDAFTQPAKGQLGDVPRNFFRGFALSQLDLAVHREFPIRESVHMQFRAEAFNIFNHPNFAGFDGDVTGQLFGQSTRTLNNSLGANSGGSGGLSSIYQVGGPRSLQLALKVIF